MRIKDKDFDTGFDTQSEQAYSAFKLSKADFELFDDAKAVPQRLVRIKRIGSVNKNEKWKVFEGSELKFTVDGTKLSKKEKLFLRTVEGVNFLIAEYKTGFRSISELRTRLKQKILSVTSLKA